MQEVLLMLAKNGFVDGELSDLKYNETAMNTVPLLPQHFIFETTNTLVAVRNSRHEDDKLLFNMFRSNAELGLGFALYDLPNLATFRHELLLKGVCFVFEDAKNGSVIGWHIIGPSSFVRSKQANCAEIATVVSTEYQASKEAASVTQMH